jgi:hypothetical protein
MGGKVGQINSTLHRSVDETHDEVGTGTLHININIYEKRTLQDMPHN